MLFTNCGTGLADETGLEAAAVGSAGREAGEAEGCGVVRPGAEAAGIGRGGDDGGGVGLWAAAAGTGRGGGDAGGGVRLAAAAVGAAGKEVAGGIAICSWFSISKMRSGIWSKSIGSNSKFPGSTTAATAFTKLSELSGLSRSFG